MKVGRSSRWKTVVFWLFLVVCLVLLFGVISQNTKTSANQNQGQIDDHENGPVSHPRPSASDALIKQSFPLLVIASGWALIFLVWVPYSLRRRYRKDPIAQGDITVKIEPESFELRTANSLLQSRWNVFKNWTEKKDFVLLRYYSGLFQILVVSGLNDDQRTEMKRILSNALPKR